MEQPVLVESQQAEPPQRAAPMGPGGRVRLHAEGSLAGWSYTKVDDPLLEMSERHTLGFGFGRPTLVDRALGAWGLGVGVSLPGDRAVLGTQFSLTVAGSSTELGAKRWDTRAAGRLIPYLRWVTRPGYKLRPYLQGHAGVGGVNLIDKASDGSFEEVSSVFPVFGGGIGIHYFPVRQVSLDLGLRFDYVPMFARMTTRDAEGKTQRGDYRRQAALYDAGVVVGLSIWFDGKGHARPQPAYR